MDHVCLWLFSRDCMKLHFTTRAMAFLRPLNGTVLSFCLSREEKCFSRIFCSRNREVLLFENVSCKNNWTRDLSCSDYLKMP